jgi:hypothetical protein
MLRRGESGAKCSFAVRRDDAVRTARRQRHATGLAKRPESAMMKAGTCRNAVVDY